MRTLVMPRAKGLARRKNKTANINVNNVNAARPGFGTHLSKWFLQLGALALVYTVGKYLDSIRYQFYVFEPEFIHAVARSAVEVHGPNTTLIISHIIENLTTEYPQITSPPVSSSSPPSCSSYSFPPSLFTPTRHTLPGRNNKRISLNPDSEEWVFNNAGGAMGAMYVIHASITEYLIISGTPLGSEGHTGLYPLDNYFYILRGEQWAFSAGDVEKEVYIPGDVHLLKRGTVKQYKMHEDSFALELAQGWIPLMLPFGLADILSSALDPLRFYHTARIIAREMYNNILIGKI
ncbi:C-8 sterol isomerase [Pyrrhoderma noxium]|uniref:C-8 sterol isomerase n=1 Tax=Pyrrhoderma noxium TaxID=2282107 RepID=A0A286U7I1_9AGAM|nr:C-8 sterol isomerase [Pyrrhoderma noxium]